MRPRESSKLGVHKDAKCNASLAPAAKVFCQRLLFWFRRNARDLPWRHKTSAYKTLIAEKLLQQTDVAHVLRVYKPFFRRFPSLPSLASASVVEIQETIRPLGFWRQRAPQLKRMATILVKKHGAKIPNSRQALMELPGVGLYIANSFLTVACAQNEFAIDVNVRTVARRLFYWPGPVSGDKELEPLFKEAVPASKTKALNWAILDFAALICRKTPRCNQCFATDSCKYYRSLRVPIDVGPLRKREPSHKPSADQI